MPKEINSNEVTIYLEPQVRIYGECSGVLRLLTGLWF